MGIQDFFNRPQATRRLAVAVFGLFAIAGTLGSAQTVTQQAVAKDPQAVAALNAVLIAMGGQSAISAIQDATVTGQSQSSDSSVPPDQVTWKSIGMSVRSEAAMSDGTHVSVVSQGKGQRKDPAGKVTAIDGRVSLTVFPYHLPGTVLIALLNASDRSLSYIADPASDGNLIHIRSVQQMTQPLLSPLTQQDWFFDPKTALPVRVSFYLPDLKNQRLDGTATIVFTNWQTASSIQVPHTIQLFCDGTLQSTVNIGAPAFNKGLSTSTLQIQ